MASGKVKKLTDRGFGFIARDDGDDLFFHANELRRPLQFNDLQEGNAVEFDIGSGPKGPVAKNVQLQGAQTPSSAGSSAQQQHKPHQPQATANKPPHRFLNPYNFIRFPPVSHAEDNDIPAKLLGRCEPPPHDRYVGYSGRITCSLENITPLFIANSEGFQRKKDHPTVEFFKLDGKHAIPSTSLRGMFRSVFEAVTNSCLPMLDDDRHSKHLETGQALRLVPVRVEKPDDEPWRVRVLSGTTPLNYGEKPRGPQYAAWVPRYVGQPIPDTKRPRPPQSDYEKRENVQLGNLQHRSICWALIEPMKHPRKPIQFWNVLELESEDPNRLQPGGNQRVVEGILCLSNQNIETKHDERFFFFDDGTAGCNLAQAETINIDPETPVIRDYETLIVEYQERHAKEIAKRKKSGLNPEMPNRKSKPQQAAFSRFIVHKEYTKLRHGDLLYAMINRNKELEFLVPVSVPRVLYPKSVAQLLPDAESPDCSLEACTDYESLCPACRTFGWVHQRPEKDRPIVAPAGRLEFSYGKLNGDADTLDETPLAILSSPKPTTVQFYLKNPGGKRKGYDADNELAGRKFYRDHGEANPQEYRRVGNKTDDQNRTVKDALKPGHRFTFTIHFRNLAAAELGMLLWTLELGGQGVHRLGFAKPLGFGSVKPRVDSVELLDTARRYGELSDDGWTPRTREEWTEQFVSTYQAAICRRYDLESFEHFGPIRDLRALTQTPPNELPVHYPRPDRTPNADGKNFEWFMANTRKDDPFHLPEPPDDTQGFPPMRKGRGGVIHIDE